MEKPKIDNNNSLNRPNPAPDLNGNAPKASRRPANGVVAIRDSIVAPDGRLFYLCRFCNKLFAVKKERAAHVKTCSAKAYILSVGDESPKESPPEPDIPVKVEAPVTKPNRAFEAIPPPTDRKLKNRTRRKEIWNKVATDEITIELPLRGDIARKLMGKDNWNESVNHQNFSKEITLEVSPLPSKLTGRQARSDVVVDVTQSSQDVVNEMPINECPVEEGWDESPRKVSKRRRLWNKELTIEVPFPPQLSDKEIWDELIPISENKKRSGKAISKKGANVGQESCNEVAPKSGSKPKILNVPPLKSHLQAKLQESCNELVASKSCNSGIEISLGTTDIKTLSRVGPKTKIVQLDSLLKVGRNEVVLKKIPGKDSSDEVSLNAVPETQILVNLLPGSDICKTSPKIGANTRGAGKEKTNIVALQLPEITFQTVREETTLKVAPEKKTLVSSKLAPRPKSLSIEFIDEVTLIEAEAAAKIEAPLKVAPRRRILLDPKLGFRTKSLEITNKFKNSEKIGPVSVVNEAPLDMVPRRRTLLDPKTILKTKSLEVTNETVFKAEDGKKIESPLKGTPRRTTLLDPKLNFRTKSLEVPSEATSKSENLKKIAPLNASPLLDPKSVLKPPSLEIINDASVKLDGSKKTVSESILNETPPKMVPRRRTLLDPKLGFKSKSLEFTNAAPFECREKKQIGPETVLTESPLKPSSKHRTLLDPKVGSKTKIFETTLEPEIGAKNGSQPSPKPNPRGRPPKLVPIAKSSNIDLTNESPEKISNEPPLKGTVSKLPPEPNFLEVVRIETEPPLKLAPRRTLLTPKLASNAKNLQVTNPLNETSLEVKSRRSSMAPKVAPSNSKEEDISNGITSNSAPRTRSLMASRSASNPVNGETTTRPASDAIATPIKTSSRRRTLMVTKLDPKTEVFTGTPRTLGSKSAPASSRDDEILTEVSLEVTPRRTKVASKKSLRVAPKTPVRSLRQNTKTRFSEMLDEAPSVGAEPNGIFCLGETLNQKVTSGVKSVSCLETTPNDVFAFTEETSNEMAPRRKFRSSRVKSRKVGKAAISKVKVQSTRSRRKVVKKKLTKKSFPLRTLRTRSTLKSTKNSVKDGGKTPKNRSNRKEIKTPLKTSPRLTQNGASPRTRVTEIAPPSDSIVEEEVAKINNETESLIEALLRAQVEKVMKNRSLKRKSDKSLEDSGIAAKKRRKSKTLTPKLNGSSKIDDPKSFSTPQTGESTPEDVDAEEKNLSTPQTQESTPEDVETEEKISSPPQTPHAEENSRSQSRTKIETDPKSKRRKVETSSSPENRQLETKRFLKGQRRNQTSPKSKLAVENSELQLPPSIDRIPELHPKLQLDLEPVETTLQLDPKPQRHDDRLGVDPKIDDVEPIVKASPKINIKQNIVLQEQIDVTEILTKNSQGPIKLTFSRSPSKEGGGETCFVIKGATVAGESPNEPGDEARKDPEGLKEADDRTATVLKETQNRSSDDDPKEGSEEEDEEDSLEDRTCRECPNPTVFKTGMEMLLHVREMHKFPKVVMAMSEIKKFYGMTDWSKCPICDKPLKKVFRSAFRRHLNTHANELGHVCTVCNKKFRRADHMKEHAKRHVIEKK